MSSIRHSFYISGYEEKVYSTLLDMDPRYATNLYSLSLVMFRRRRHEFF